MNLEQSSLADTPILAQLVTDAAIGQRGALELLADDYKAPQPPIMHIATDEVHEGDSDDGDAPDAVEPESSPVQSVSEECDADGYPEMVAVSPVAAVKAAPTPSRGVSLIRPRTLADMNKAS